MWKKSTMMILGGALLLSAMSVVPKPSDAAAPTVGGCTLSVDVFTLKQLSPISEDLAYRVAFFLTDVTSADLMAPTAQAAEGEAVLATALFSGADAPWNFRRPMPGPTDPDAFVLQTPQDYFLYRPTTGSAFASLGLVGVTTEDGLSLPAFFGHINNTRFFAAEPTGDLTSCVLHPTTIFEEIRVFLDQAIAANAPDLKETSNG